MSQPSGITVKHTADNMKAFVALSGQAGQVSVGMVLSELLRHGVSHGLNTSVIHKLITAGLLDKYVEVAQGTPVKPGSDGFVEILVDGVPPVGAVDNGCPTLGAALGTAPEFAIVKAGQPLARRVPPVPGVDGVNVFGNLMAAPPVNDVKLCGGSGTAVSPNESNTLIAAHDGVFHRTQSGVISVSPYMEIAGDIDAAFGNIEFDGDVRILGAVRADVVVDVTGSLMISGEVGEAQIRCGGDLTVFSSISGGGRGIIEVGGNVRAYSVERCALMAEGGVFIDEGIAAADINSKGRIMARSIVGGSVVAAAGVEAILIGSPAGEHTVIDISPMYDCFMRREGVVSSLEAQTALTDGCVSDLFRCVRDKMDQFGVIADESMAMVQEYKKNLSDTLTVSKDLEKELKDIDRSLEAMVGCSITASEVYPNVQLKTGFSEQRAKDVLKNVNLKPAVPKIGD